MAEVAGLLAVFLIVIAVTLHFSLHKLEEGHVGVYYRVNTILILF